MSKSEVVFCVGVSAIGLGMILGIVAIGVHSDRADREAEDKAVNGECHDEAVMIATAAGTPNAHACRNRRHKMRVETATKAGEEVAAVIHCECQP